MSDELLFFEFMQYDDNDNNTKKQCRQRIREQSDPFDTLEDAEFIKRYRLSKELVLDLCEELRPLLKKAVKSTDLSVEKKVLTALSFYATGSYQRPTGDISAHSLAQQTVSQVLGEVTACLNSPEMRRKYIHFPRTHMERNRIRTRFYEKFNFPGVLGCIDCTHVAIVRPIDHEERFYCRKHYHSLNVQLICDADMQIMSVDSSFGGATHDSFIWSTHPLKTYMEELNESTWFLGDSGYALRRYLLTPIVNAALGTPEHHYTEMHVRTRNIVERTIGVLKARFRCLLVHRVLHYQPQKAAALVNACVILHNICNKACLAVPAISNEDMLQEAQMQVSESGGEGFVIATNSNNRELQQGVSTRSTVVNRLWEVRAI